MWLTRQGSRFWGQAPKRSGVGTESSCASRGKANAIPQSCCSFRRRGGGGRPCPDAGRARAWLPPRWRPPPRERCVSISAGGAEILLKRSRERWSSTAKASHRRNCNGGDFYGHEMGKWRHSPGAPTASPQRVSGLEGGAAKRGPAAAAAQGTFLAPDLGSAGGLDPQEENSVQRAWALAGEALLPCPRRRGGASHV